MKILVLIAAFSWLAFQSSDGWREADQRVQSCQNDGGKGSFENPRNCKCWNPCQEDMQGLSDYEKIHGDRHCKTTCRRDTCKCKPPCD